MTLSIPTSSLLLLFIYSLIPLFVHSFVFSENHDVKKFDLTSQTRGITFHNESIVKLHDYGSHILIGGRNAVYNVSIRDANLGYETIHWPPSDEAKTECAKISESACVNDIRVFYPTPNGFVLCGTHALKPTCAHFIGTHIHKTFSGVGQAPFQLSQSSRFLISSGYIFTATVSDFSATDPLLLRGLLNASTPQQLRSARQGAFDDTPEFVHLHTIYQDVLLWFTEMPTDTEECGVRRETRVARVCKGDPGAARPYDTEFSSFSKATVECSIREPQQDTLHFNQLSALHSAGSQRLMGVFRSQLAGLGASALCQFDTAEVSRVIHRPFSEYEGTSCPRATSQDSQLAVRSNPLIEKKIVSRPFFVYNGRDRFIDVVMEERVSNLRGERFDILWIATDLGNALKVVRGENNHTAIHVATMKLTNRSINGLSVIKFPLQNANFHNSLLAFTESGVFRGPSSACHLAESCVECARLADPECAWLTKECVPISEHMHRKKFMIQDESQCVELPKATTPAPVETTTIAQKRRATAATNLVDSESAFVGQMIRGRLKPPECLCERKEEIKGCTTEVIQNQVPARAGFLPYFFFFVFGCCVGAGIVYIIACCWRHPVDKKPPSPMFSPIEAYASTPTSQSVHSHVSDSTNRSTTTLIRATAHSKQTYC